MNVSTEGMQKWAKLVVQSWDDEDLRQRLLTDPMPDLAAAGLEFPDGMVVVVVADAAQASAFEDDVTLVLPMPPRPENEGAQQISQEALAGVVGGAVARATSSYLSSKIIPSRTPSRWPGFTSP